MKKADLTSLRTKEIKELTKALKDKKGELAKLTQKIKSGSEKNLKKGKLLKKDIAQILTVIREKEIMTKEEAK